MFLHIDSHNGVPVYEQVVRQMTYAVADGVLAPGDLLPSVRELARELAINPNTVARAYRDLQSAGVVEHAAGIGLAVERGARRECQTRRRKLIEGRLAGVLDEAFQSGLDADAIREMVLAQVDRRARRAASEKGRS